MMKTMALPSDSPSEHSQVSTRVDSAHLRALAIEMLDASPLLHGRLRDGSVHVESDGTTLLIYGRVPSFHLKQLVQESLRRLEGITQVENHLIVTDAPRPTTVN